MKRFLSLLLAMVMILSMVPAISFAAETRTVYWDPVSGADTNDGLTQTAAVKTKEAAYAALEGADEGRIVLLSSLTVTEATYFPECDIPVTITSKTGAEGISSSKNIFFNGVTTLENITLTLTVTSNSIYFSSEGHDFTIGTKVTTKSTDGSSRFCLTTKHGAGSNGNATLTVKSGDWRNIFYAGYTKATTGDAKLIMTGGSSNNLVGPSFSAKTTGNVSAHISGGNLNVLMAGPNETGNHTGNVDIHLAGGTISKVRLRRVINSKVIPINGTVTVHIEGDCSRISKILDESASGKINKTALVLKKGVLDITPTAIFDEVRVEIPENETMKLVGATIQASSVDSAGTLEFSGAAKLTAESITGTLNCRVDGTVEENHPYVTAPASAAVTFPQESGITGKDGVWQYSTVFDTENFVGLVLKTTVSGISVKLFQNYNTTDDKLLTPVYMEDTADGGTTYYYEIKPLNRYYMIVKPESGYARYNNHYNLYFTEEEAAQKTVMDVTPNKRSTNGWDPSTEIRHRTDEVMDNVYPSDASLWPQYSEIFTTPAFQPGRNEHMQTTQTEMENFIAGLDDDSDNMYVYTLGQSAGKAFDIPLVIFTTVDLSKADTLEEAAALIRADSERNGKLTVHYQAQIHGNEQAAGEAALGMLKRLDGPYGQGLMDTMNIYVIPRLSPYGAYKSQRQVYLTSSATTDPNRDFLRLRTAETQARMVAYNLFEPEVVLDGHEYQESLTSTSHKRKDLMLCTHWMPNHDATYQQTALDLAYAAFDQLTADGLYYSWYSDSVGGLGANTGSSNTAFRSSLHILMETSGINQGLLQYERRVATHNSAMTGIFAYLDANAAAVKKTVHENRQQYIENGKTYREDDIVILDATTSDHKELNIQGKMVNLYNGTLTDSTYPAYVPDVIKRYRIAPTAYVIPAGESFTEKVLPLMDKQGISYRFIPAGSALLLQQYTGTVTEAYLAEEKLTYFPVGAYVFTMDQVDGYILANLMEPDVNDTATDKGTLVQQGIITATDGKFPIYRYIHDLNEEGFVEYSILESAPKAITVYVDNTNGLDTNDGLSVQTPVKTLEKAYELMTAAQIEGEQVESTLVIIGLYDLGTTAYAFPTADYPVTITGLSTEDGISFTGGSEITDRMLDLGGDTTFQHIRLHSGNPSYTNNLLFANGHKLVMGEGVNTTVTPDKLFYFTLVGGSYDYDEDVASTSITVKSGTWRMIYCGGYRGSVTGAAELDITNASVYAGIFAAYVGNVGTAQMHISHTTVTTGGIFAGTYTANGPHKIGAVLEGSTVILGEGVQAPAVYGSARTYGNITGGATIVADGVDLANAPVVARYASLDADYGTDIAVLQLNRNVTQDVTVDPGLVLDLNGHDVIGKLTVDGTLQVKDTQTDDFTVADGVYGKITGQVSGTLVAAPGYVAVDGESFHRFGQKITGVSIRPSIAGIYYSAVWQMDEVLKGKIHSFGVAVSLSGMPDAGFMDENSGALWTQFAPAALKNGKPMTSVMISNILSPSAANNDSRGKSKIYATPYIRLIDGTVLVSETQVAYSLYDVMKKADTQAYEANKAALEAFYLTWQDVMKDWDFQNIGGQGPQPSRARCN